MRGGADASSLFLVGLTAVVFIAIIGVIIAWATGAFKKKEDGSVPMKPTIPEDQKHYSQDTM
jgi:hypothetical protein